MTATDSTTTHGCYAGGITGLFDDDASGVAALVTSFFFTGFGVIFNPAVFLTADGNTAQPISSPGIYNCINRGSMYLENGTYENGAGGIVGTGGLITFHNPDFTVFNCLNLGDISADENNAEHVAAMVGNGVKFSERDCYYTNCTRSSANNEGIHFTESGMSRQEVAEALGNAFKYENDDIFLNFENYQFLQSVENAGTETFTQSVAEESITLSAPDIRADLKSPGSESDTLIVTCETADYLNKMETQVSLTPYFTDLVYTDEKSFTININTNMYKAEDTMDELVPGQTYYIRARGRTTFFSTDDGCEYTEWAYLNVTLEDDAVLRTSAGQLLPEPEPATEPETVTKLGDATLDGAVNILDVITINRVILGKETLDAQALNNIDFNKNGKPDSEESLAVMKFIVGLITETQLEARTAD